jgi:hypothetical protein
MLTTPQVTDGLTATGNALVECLNLSGSASLPATTYQRYEYLSDSISVEGVDQDYTDGDNAPLGGRTAAGFEKGAIPIKVTPATAKLPKPGYILHCDFGDGDEFYRVTAQGRSRSKGGVKTGSPAVTRLIHPFVQDCLTEAYGSRAIKTQAAGALTGSFTTALTQRLTRAGGTITFSLGAEPGESVPAWLSINASTGALSGTAVAGTYNLHIIITDTLANFATLKGYGVLTLIIT